MIRRVAMVLCLLVVACAPNGRIDSAWTDRAQMGVARSEHPAVILDDQIVVLGGLIETAPGRFGVTASVESYDPRRDSWASLADLPQARHHNMAAVLEGRLFAIGGFSESGFTATDRMWELVDGVWVDRAPLAQAVGAGAAVTVGGRLFVVGGTPGGGLQAYDPSNDSWEILPAPVEFREHLAAVVFEGEIWAIGGRRPGLIHDSVEIFDVESGTWRPGPALLNRRSGFGAAVIDGLIFVAGGEVFDPDEALESTERFDPLVGEWEEFDPLPVGLHGNPLVARHGSLYLPGGSMRAAGVENAGELFAIEVG